jgi:phosphoribosylglycinamide formyltransferase-1
MKKMAVFASGTGSNAQKIIDHFSDKTKNAEVALIVCNKQGAGVLDVAAKAGIPSIIIQKDKFFRGDGYLAELNSYKIDFIVLAGFLWKIPRELINAYPRRIINIHPALLPKYGGEGMYGNFVHEAVLIASEPETGITIHYVDEHYDHGDIIFQAKCAVTKTDNAETLSKKIHLLEHQYYPSIIEKVISKL